MSPKQIPLKQSHRFAFTLIEVVIAAALTTLLTASLAGMTLAARQSQDRLTHFDRCRGESRVAFDRIDRAVQRSGTYKPPAAATVPGVRAISKSGYYTEWSTTLVCLTGGRDGDLSAASPLDRLPLASELLVFTDIPEGSGTLCEVAFPGDTQSVNLATASSATIRSLVNGPTAEVAPLCRTIRRYSDPSDIYYGGSTIKSAVFFNVRHTPSSALIARDGGTEEGWLGLPWYRHQRTPHDGLRHTLVRVELQFPNRATPHVGAQSDAYWPVFAGFEKVARHAKP